MNFSTGFTIFLLTVGITLILLVNFTELVPLELVLASNLVGWILLVGGVIGLLYILTIPEDDYKPYDKYPTYR